VESQAKAENPHVTHGLSSKTIQRLKFLAIALTTGGIGVFVYFIYAVGIHEILEGVGRIGLAGFGAVVVIYFMRIVMRAWAWQLSVYEPYALSLRDTVPAVIIGEAMSAMIPLGILISGTTKAVAVRRRLPLVVGLSSVATENLFYSLITSIFLILGALTFIRSFHLEEAWATTIDALILVIAILIILVVLMVIRQWHFASETCEWFYQKGVARRFLENGRLEVRLFENLIYGFYRRYPKRFIPICLLETSFHVLGILESWFILGRISAAAPEFLTAFLLESVSRLITIVFKLVPFLIGVDEAGAQFVTETLALGASIGISLAIIRKGRILFWTAIGVMLILKRGLSLRDLTHARHQSEHVTD
jgi:glycosyltransferase 2 family protein